MRAVAQDPGTSFPRFNCWDAARWRRLPSMPAHPWRRGVFPDTHTVHGGCGGMSGRPVRPLETMQAGSTRAHAHTHPAAAVSLCSISFVVAVMISRSPSAVSPVSGLVTAPSAPAQFRFLPRHRQDTQWALESNRQSRIYEHDSRGGEKVADDATGPLTIICAN